MLKIISSAEGLKHRFLTEKSIRFLSKTLGWSGALIRSIPKKDAEIINSAFWQKVIRYIVKRYGNGLHFQVGLFHFEPDFQERLIRTKNIYADIEIESMDHFSYMIIGFKIINERVALVDNFYRDKPPEIFYTLNNALKKRLERYSNL